MGNDLLLGGITLFAVVNLFVVIALYIKVRTVFNRMLDIAVNEFHEAADSIMKTPDDVPDSALEALAAMNKVAFTKGGPRKFRDKVRRDRLNKLPRSAAQLAARAELDDMRPELQDLMMKASLAFYEIICRRSILFGTLIQFEFARLQASKGKIDRRPEKEAVKILPDLCSAY